MAIQITDDNFEEIVIQSDKPVVLDFWAEWCPPCKNIGTFMDEMTQEYQGVAVMGKMDTDHNSIVPTKHGVRNLPTILFFKQGKLVDKIVGFVPKNILQQKLNAIL